jgi:hypothetical protein
MAGQGLETLGPSSGNAIPVAGGCQVGVRAQSADPLNHETSTTSSPQGGALLDRVCSIETSRQSAWYSHSYPASAELSDLFASPTL